MAIIIIQRGAVGQNDVAFAGVHILEALHRSARKADYLPKALCELRVSFQRGHSLLRGAHGHGAPAELELVPYRGAVAPGNHDIVARVGAVLRVLPGVDLLLVERDAAPSTVDIAGGQLDIHVLLLYRLDLQRPAKAFAHRHRKLHVEAPVVSVHDVGHGEGVDVHADYKRPRLRHTDLFKRLGVLFEVDYAGAEPFAGQVADRALGVERLDGGGHVVICTVVIAEGKGIFLLHKHLQLAHPVGAAAAGAEAERHTQYEHGAYHFLHPHHHYALFTPNGGRDGRRGGAFSFSRL